MERRVKPDPDAVLWKKTGGGSFHATINGKLRIIKPNETFYAKEEEIPAAFRDVVKLVEPEKVAEIKQAYEEKVAASTAPKFELQHRGGGWWNVVSEDGKVMNENALKKDEAEELVDNLTKS